MRSGLTSAGHMERRGDDKLTKRADAQKVGRKRKTEIAMGVVVRDTERVSEEWRKGATDRMRE